MIGCDPAAILGPPTRPLRQLLPTDRSRHCGSQYDAATVVLDLMALNDGLCSICPADASNLVWAPEHLKSLDSSSKSPHWRLQYMYFNSKQLLRAVSASALVATMAIPHGIFAQASEHLVSPTDLREAVVDASRARQQNLDTLHQFFSSDKARQALQASHIDSQQVKSAVAALSDEQLAQLASHAHKAQKDFAAGNL